MSKFFGSIQSSENVDQISLTLKGVLSTVAPLLIHVLNKKGITVTTETTDGLIAMILVLVSTSVTLYGAIRRLINFSEPKTE